MNNPPEAEAVCSVNQQENNIAAPSHHTVEPQPQLPRRRATVQNLKFKKTDFIPPNTEWLGSVPPPPVNEMTPFEYFKSLFPDDLITYISEQTCIFAMQKDGVELKLYLNVQQMIFNNFSVFSCTWVFVKCPQLKAIGLMNAGFLPLLIQ